MTRLQEVSPDGVFRSVDQTPEAQERKDIETLTRFTQMQQKKIAILEDTVTNLQTINAGDRKKYREEADNWEPRIEKLTVEGKERQAAYKALEQRVEDIKRLVASCDLARVKELEKTIAEQHAAIADFGPTIAKLMSASETIKRQQLELDKQKLEIRELRDKAAIPANLQYYANSLAKIMDGIAASPHQDGLPGEVQEMLNKVQMTPGPSGWQPTGVKPELEID